MEDEDTKLFSALDGDSDLFGQIIGKLHRRAISKSRGLFSDFALAEDVAIKAINKAKEWLLSGEPYTVEYPMLYLRKIVNNSIIDSARNRNEELSYITKEEYQSITGDFKDVDAAEFSELTKYRVFKPKEDSDNSQDEFPSHNWLRVLHEIKYYLFRSAFKDTFRTDLLNPYYVITPNEPYNQEIANKIYLHLKRELKKIIILVDCISSQSEKRVVTLFLWGYRQVDISSELKISKPYVSRIVKKWLNLWQWNKDAYQRARLLLLIKNFFDTYDRTSHHRGKFKLSVAKELGISSYPNCTQEETIKIDEKIDEYLYNLLKTRNETKVYFSDLNMEDIPDINKIYVELKRVFKVHPDLI